MQRQYSQKGGFFARCTAAGKPPLVLIPTAGCPLIRGAGQGRCSGSSALGSPVQLHRGRRPADRPSGGSSGSGGRAAGGRLAADWRPRVVSLLAARCTLHSGAQQRCRPARRARWAANKQRGGRRFGSARPCPGSGRASLWRHPRPCYCTLQRIMAVLARCSLAPTLLQAAALALPYATHHLGTIAQHHRFLIIPLSPIHSCLSHFPPSSLCCSLIPEASSSASALCSPALFLARPAPLAAPAARLTPSCAALLYHRPPGARDLPASALPPPVLFEPIPSSLPSGPAHFIHESVIVESPISASPQRLCLIRLRLGPRRLGPEPAPRRPL